MNKIIKSLSFSLLLFTPFALSHAADETESTEAKITALKGW